jgi:hypothetical protein
MNENISHYSLAFIIIKFLNPIIPQNPLKFNRRGEKFMNAFILNNTINSRTDLGLRITQPPVAPISRQIVKSIPVDGTLVGKLVLEIDRNLALLRR